MDWQIDFFFTVLTWIDRSLKPQHDHDSDGCFSLTEGRHHSNPTGLTQGNIPCQGQWVPLSDLIFRSCHEYRKFNDIHFVPVCHTKRQLLHGSNVCTASWRDVNYSLQSNCLSLRYRANELQVRIGNRQIPEPLPLRNLVEGIPKNALVSSNAVRNPRTKWRFMARKIINERFSPWLEEGFCWMFGIDLVWFGGRCSSMLAPEPLKDTIDVEKGCRENWLPTESQIHV